MVIVLVIAEVTVGGWRVQGRLEEEMESSTAGVHQLHRRLAAPYKGPAFSLTCFRIHVVMIAKPSSSRVNRGEVVGTVQVRLLKVRMAFLMAPAAVRPGEVLHRQPIHLV